MTRRGRLGPGCFVCLDKPAGPTSFDLVRQVRRVTGYRRAGHGGTLDPFATGLLVVAIGSATRLLRFLAGADKRYVATFRFGITTDTDDATGQPLAQAPIRFARADLQQGLQQLVGAIQQRPPRVSAVKVAGRRAYALHRSGGEVPELAARTVVVHAIELLEFTPPLARVAVECGGGTYIRSLARDLGERLGSGAHVEQLRRERVGCLQAARAVAPEVFAAEWPLRGMAASGVVPAAQALSDLPQLTLAAAELPQVRCGRLVAATADRVARAAGAASPCGSGAPDAGERRVALLDAAGEVVAVAAVGGSRARLLVVLPEQENGDVPGTL